MARPRRAGNGNAARRQRHDQERHEGLRLTYFGWPEGPRSAVESDYYITRERRLPVAVAQDHRNLCWHRACIARQLRGRTWLGIARSKRPDDRVVRPDLVGRRTAWHSRHGHLRSRQPSSRQVLPRLEGRPRNWFLPIRCITRSFRRHEQRVRRQGRSCRRKEERLALPICSDDPRCRRRCRRSILRRHLQGRQAHWHCNLGRLELHVEPERCSWLRVPRV